ncbi:MAG: thiamine pyrophosphate-binding protein, partial [Candidatus Latescibacteria bacterium]|nr:thiamine pyrophosphate-binding protein [Candidatus Latescibacterota bacterium]
DGYARSTGKVGVSLVTSGPAATNTVTALATAQMDSVPIVVLTGQVSSGLIGSDAFQETDAIGVTRPVVKHSFMIKETADVPSIIRQAFHIASTGRPGPVVVDLPKDVMTDSAVFEWPGTPDIRGYRPNTGAGDPEDVAALVEAINSSERPYLYLGGGIVISDAQDEVTQLAHKANIPVTTTLMGLGGFDGTDPLFVGMPGMHGSKAANLCFQESDLVVSIGSRFDDRVTGRLDRFAPKAKFGHVDVDPSSVKKIVEVDYPVIGDAKKVLKALLPLVKERAKSEWNEQVDEWRGETLFPYPPSKDVIRPQYVVEQIYELTKDRDAYICTEVGQHQMWSAQYYRFAKPRRWASSGGLGTMGYGFPAAIGVQLAHP